MARRSFRLFQLIQRSTRRSSAGTLSLSAVATAGLATDAASSGGKADIDLALEFGMAYLPHPDKLFKGGEDASFYNHSLNAFGVADGVGAWSTMGIDPARFSRKLMRFSEYAFVNDATAPDQSQPLWPVQALRQAYDDVRGLGIQGSCTALIGVLRGNTLHLANLGDSGAMILARNEDTSINGSDEEVLAKLSISKSVPDRESILKGTLVAEDKDQEDDLIQPSIHRGYEIAFKTEDLLHRFNCPYQLGLESSDAPEAASISQHSVKVGDLIIAGSDGLWDNLFDNDIHRLADESDDVTELAYIIATAASRRASKTRGARATPFAVDAAEAGIVFAGGKMDDITVIVAKVVPGGRRMPKARSRL